MSNNQSSSNMKKMKLALAVGVGVALGSSLNSMSSTLSRTLSEQWDSGKAVAKISAASAQNSIRSAASRLSTSTMISTKKPGVHMALLSDRYEGMAVTLNSICKSSQHKSDLVFHIFTDDKNVVNNMYNNLPDCKDEATLNLISIEEATVNLKDMGFDPFWDRPKPDLTGTWYLETPYTTDKHAHPLNLLRFYLPHLPDFDGVERLIFLDDDLVFMKDMAELNDWTIPNDNVMASGCRHWIWNSNIPGNFETSTHFTVDQTGYIGPMETRCVDRQPGDDIALCTHEGLNEKLAEVSLRIDPEAPMADKPMERIAFNMGLNIIDIPKWKNKRLSEKFEAWVEASIWERLFAPDTLAFGLGLGYFAMTAYSECYDDEIEHLVGLGFVTKESLAYVGWTTDDMKEKAFALHYNGGGKPWKAPMPACTAQNASYVLENPQNALEIWQKSCIDADMCKCNMTGSVEFAEGSGEQERRVLRTESTEHEKEQFVPYVPY